MNDGLVARSAAGPSVDQFENPAASGGGHDGAGSGPPTAETPFYCRVLRVLLRLAGVHSLWHWRAVHGLLMTHVVCFFLQAYNSNKYKDNSDDPQRPFLAAMHAYLICWGSAPNLPPPT